MLTHVSNVMTRSFTIRDNKLPQPLFQTVRDHLLIVITTM